jgi:hypothetical protein
MSDRMRKYVRILRSLLRLTDAEKKKMIRLCDRGLVDCFSECAKNVLKGTVPLTSAQLRKLRRQKNNLRLLAVKKTSVKKKKKILQKGGFIGAIIPPILSILGGLFGGYGAH